MDSTPWRTRWVTSKAEIALALDNGAGGASYSEAAIIISSALTALAAELWPGWRQDRARFIELLVRMAPPAPVLETISVPLLVQYLHAKGRGQEAEALAKELLPAVSSQVITGPEVDRTESVLLALIPSLQPTSLRRFSYACLIYEQLRSSYAHQYQPGERADSWPMTMLPNQTVSYVNKITERRIHFHIEWLAQIAVGVVKNVDAKFAENMPSRPPVWWIDQHNRPDAP